MITAVVVTGCIASVVVCVIKCCNNFLWDQYFAANGTVLAFGKTGCGTGWGNCFVNNLGMIKCFNNLLCYEYFVTY